MPSTLSAEACLVVSGGFFGLKLYSRLAKGRCGETRRLVLRRVKFWRESTPARVESVVHRMIFIAGVRPAPLRERLSLGRIAVQHQRYKRATLGVVVSTLEPQSSTKIFARKGLPNQREGGFKQDRLSSTKRRLNPCDNYEISARRRLLRIQNIAIINHDHHDHHDDDNDDADGFLIYPA